MEAIPSNRSGIFSKLISRKRSDGAGRWIVAFGLVFLLVGRFFGQNQLDPSPQNSHVTLFFYHSPLGIDWTAPRNLARSVVKNENSGQRRAIGHVTVELSCGHSGERIWTGMSDDSVNYRSLVFKQGYGLGIMFENVPGRLENEAHLQKELEDLAQAGRVHALDVLVSHTTCDRMQTYLREFRERGVMKWYGLPNRPRHEEGAGCSAFGVSFLEIAGLMREEWKSAWSRHLLVPEMWIGGENTHRKVPFKKLYLLRKKLNHWEQHEGPVREVTFWDPDLMHDWVKAAFERIQANELPDFKAIIQQGVPTVVWDARTLPPPNEPFWLGKSEE